MRRVVVILILLGLVFVALAALLVDAPGYMDAEYYYSGGLRLAGGHGLTEMILWNYLGEMPYLPAPSHTYWMPLPSLLAAVGIYLAGQATFTAARIPLLLLAALIPALTAVLAYTLTRQMRHAWLAGLLALFPGYYLPYWVTTDTFALVMLLGGGLLLVAFPRPGARSISSAFHYALLGLLAGLMHLCRADGLLWLGAVVALAALTAWQARKDAPRWAFHGLSLALVTLLGYALVTGFWYARNLQEFGALMPPGGSRALWLTEYDQTYLYPAARLTPAHLFAGGLGPLLRARWGALLQNLQTFLAVQGSVFLLPLALMGLWRLRSNPRVGMGALLWLLVLAVMSAAFPFAGARGGFLHSGAAFQPLLWAGVPVGLDAFIQIGVRLRNWQPARAYRGFSIILVGLAAVLSLALYVGRVIGPDPAHPAWSASWRAAQEAERGLVEHGARRFNLVMVNNPPGYFAATGRAAIAIPHGDEAALLEVGYKYGASYVIIETNHVTGLNDLYAHPSDRPGLFYLGARGDARYFQIIEPSHCEFCP